MGDPGNWSITSSGPMVKNNILVQEIDLSYAIFAYNRALKNGELFAMTFGKKAGFCYYDDEDRGIFWSNDPQMTVREMMEKLNLKEEREELQHDLGVYRRAGIRA